VVDKVAIEQVFLREMLFSLVTVIPPMLRIRSYVYHRRELILVNESNAKQHAYETR
jgi:hypothetical protein